MSKNVTLEISQNEFNRFNEELVRVVAVMQEQQRESEERWEQITGLREETAKLRAELSQRLQDVDKYLGSFETARQLR